MPIRCLCGVTFNIGVEILTSFDGVAFLIISSDTNIHDLNVTPERSRGHSQQSVSAPTTSRMIESVEGPGGKCGCAPPKMVALL